jgi:hypothetical protein
MGLGALLLEVRLGRFARVGCPRCGATGMHLARLRTCALNPAWTAGFRGRSLKFVRVTLAGRAWRLRMCAGNALDVPVLRLAKYTPAAPLVHPGGWDKRFLQIFSWFGQRRAVEAATLPAAGSATCRRA